MEYEPVVDERGRRLGWRAKDQAAWRAPLARVDAPAVDERTLSYEAILDELEPWAPNLTLRARLAVHYQLDPVRVSRLTSAILGTPGVRNPCALLSHRLGELEHGET